MRAEATGTSELSVHDFVVVIRRSRLVDDERLKAALHEVDLKAIHCEDVSQLLIENELLTPWQCRQLLKGRWKGYRLGKYLLLDELGRGGMAKVFLARHETLRHQVAIKVLARQRLKKASSVHRFLREARAAAQISHPNIVRVFDVDVEEDRHYLVMEYVSGRSVQDLVDLDGPLSFHKAARFLQQAAEGLACAHKQGLIHRDVKPANLLVEDGKTVKLSDFGLARAGGEDDDDMPSLTMQHDERVLGTADYIAPEQAVNSHTVDARADLYSLGYTLYFMLTGQPPFPTGRIVERITKHCTQEPESIRTFRPTVPEELLKIWQKMTRKRPEDRYESAAAVSGALERFLADDASSSSSELVAGSRIVHGAQSSVLIPRSASDTDDELELAPEEDDYSTSQSSASAAADSSGTEVEDEELLPLDDDAVLDDDLTGGDGDFSGVCDALDDDALVSAASAGAASPSSVMSDSDVHGNHVDRQLTGPSRVDTATSGALPTGADEKPTVGERLARFYHRMQRGEYPLWLLIGAGLIFGALIILIGYSLFYSFFIDDTPVKWGTEGG